MKPKCTAALQLVLALLLFCACAPAEKPQITPEPTAQAAAAPTETPTAAPTAVPNEAPTAEPTAVPTETPLVFPTPGRMGNLNGGGPILPEGAEYLGIGGEMNLYYIYDRFGELVDIIDLYGYPSGFYGPHGAPGGYSIERGEQLPHCLTFGDMILDCSFMEERDEQTGEITYSGYTLDRISNIYFEELVSFDEGAIRLGMDGAVLRIDGMYLILNTTIDDPYGNSPIEYAEPPMLLDETGGLIRTLDTEQFGRIKGVYGGKYLMIENMLSYGECDLYTLDGECVKKTCSPQPNGWFQLDYDRSYYYLSADYMNNRSGAFYDTELNRIGVLPDDARVSPWDAVYGMINDSEYTIVHGSIYSGVMDGDGNWLFRIYRPELANDSLPRDW
jgi:hypothetical protein